MRTAPFALLAIILTMLAGAGCQSDGTSAVSSLTVATGYTPGTGMFSAGVTITFKAGPPSAHTLIKLEACGALKVEGTPEVWIISTYHRRDAAQNIAIEAALREGAVLTKLK